MYAFWPPVHTDTLENAQRFHRKQILLKTLLKVNRIENATASVSVWMQINRCVFTPFKNAFKQKRISVDMASVKKYFGVTSKCT